MPRADWRHPAGPDSNLDGRANHPVVQVSHEDARAYAHWAGLDLPSEAQWEYAARGGLQGAVYSWGSEPDSAQQPKGNFWRGIFPLVNEGSRGFKGTSPVGCFPANGYGLFDMAGNVWQWTDESWGGDAYVIKGGSYLCATNYCLRYRPAARQPGDAGSASVHIGFRTVSNAR